MGNKNMALNETIRIRVNKNFKKRFLRVARNSKPIPKDESTLGREAIFEYVERREKELGINQEAKAA